MTVLQFLQLTDFVPARAIRINDINSNDNNITFTQKWDIIPVDNPILAKYADCIILKIFIYNDEVSLLLRGND